ncbi:hypothetical protein B0A55_01672 [Friedmanniomyces simplex]|uniref:Uncharacterized protein n=1 Tax=Friedmanniomyces simplex TaxID=329884 RepID=A0A4U0XT25_9PEZI|nr:hypothetical protein B0A55_01672 [Friedmanniomyces simplex]
MFPGVAMMSFDQMREDQARALEQTPAAEEQLPAYSDAVNGRSPAYITEKEISQHQQQQSKQWKGPGKMSTIKSILTGEVHKHNPRYVLEESVTGQRTVPRSTTPKSSETKPKSKPSQSTLKSILTGDVHKFHPMYRVEENADARLRSQR